MTHREKPKIKKGGCKGIQRKENALGLLHLLTHQKWPYRESSYKFPAQSSQEATALKPALVSLKEQDTATPLCLRLVGG